MQEQIMFLLGLQGFLKGAVWMSAMGLVVVTIAAIIYLTEDGQG